MCKPCVIMWLILGSIVILMIGITPISAWLTALIMYVAALTVATQKQKSIKQRELKMCNDICNSCINKTEELGKGDYLKNLSLSTLNHPDFTFVKVPLMKLGSIGIKHIPTQQVIYGYNLLTMLYKLTPLLKKTAWYKTLNKTEVLQIEDKSLSSNNMTLGQIMETVQCKS